MRQNNNYQLVDEAETIGLDHNEAFVYFKARLQTPEDPEPQLMDRSTYYRLLAKVEARKEKTLFILAKTLPQVHVTQIKSLRIVRKKLFTKFLNETNTKLVIELSKAIIEVERAISEYNGWTQKLSEETVKLVASTKTEEPPALYPPGS